MAALANATFDDVSARDLAAIEQITQEVGRYLFEHLEVRRPSLWERRWWDDRIMAWAMHDEAVKVQLFRFIDVLPMLTTPDAVARHLEEYLDDVRDRLPSAARFGLVVATPTRLGRRGLAAAARRNALAHAKRFIAGTDVKEVLAAALHQRRLKRAFTLDVLGEAVASDIEADQWQRAYLDLIEQLSPTVNAWTEIPQIDRDERGPLPRVNVSIKLSALDSQFDAIDPDGSAERVGARLRPMLRAARRLGAFVNVDMESYRIKALTLHVFQQVLMEEEFRDFADVGIVLQCYLKDTEADLVSLRDWAVRRGTPVWVRLVKGAYWDYETVHALATGWPVPVFQQKWQSDANFERLTRFALLNAQHLRTALGSHNIRSLAHGIAVVRHLELPREAFELQMLYGMADAEKQALVEAGYRLRIYMPYGELIPGMAYLVRRLLENTSNDSFLRASFTEHVSPEVLLMNPLDHSEPQSKAAEPTSGSIVKRQSSDQAAETVVESPIRTRYGRTGDELPAFRNEPPVDFAVPRNREAMQTALADVRKQFGRSYPLVIDGERVETQAEFVSRDPSDISQAVGNIAAAEKQRTAAAVAAAKQALPEWSGLGARRRAEYLLEAAAVMRRRRFELAAWEVYECGKGWREADADVCEAIDFCEYYARGAIELEAQQEVTVPGEENRLLYMPRGVAAVIAPWNFPLAILTGMTTAALATGNTVILKSAEESSVVAAKLMEIFQEIDLPAGAAHYLPGKGEVVGAALVEHPDVALIAFTGSRAVGLAINAKAAEVSARGIGYVKHAICEMGGKNAIIVDEDADLDEAVLGVVKSAFGYQGQKCSACSRCIVLASIYDVFLARLVEATRSLKVGPADDPATSVGPVIDADSVRRIQNYIDIGRMDGREVLAVNTDSLKQRGYFVGPHIFADVPASSRLAQEEVFGPVLAVIKAENLTEAIKIANGTDYALTGGMYSRSPANLDRVCREFQVGNLYLNRPITGAYVGRQPFGGFKLSGIGSKAGGPDYLLQFVLPRTITENTLRRGFAPPTAEHE
ncbi:MAG TPA: L-glutamate gamma-semialdehyde dehydrogenase [Pirellulales bacterium]|nr:L-glutamate gamma-semialdehyde dehydrogenase [Pirellulales bacterium]